MLKTANVKLVVLSLFVLENILLLCKEKLLQ